MAGDPVGYVYLRGEPDTPLFECPRDMDKLAEDDEFTYTNDGVTTRYKVEGVEYAIEVTDFSSETNSVSNMYRPTVVNYTVSEVRPR